ncbi:MAG: ATP-dependent DNA ligase [Candidatus Caldarchaeum sp.]|uniref:DNA ligase n=1 Tax=Caldiarchaeum subterraneum TaxID=311458 RepID=A0A7C4E034_CALS0
MLFRELVDFYERLEATTKRLEMTDILAELLSKTPPDIIDKVVYMTLGEIYPAYRGLELGVAEKLALRVVKQVTGASEKEVDEAYARHGDVGNAAMVLLRRKPQTTLFTQELTVQDVYSAFEKIARSTGPGAVDVKMSILAGLLAQASPVEAKHILRIVTGNMRLGVADMTILDALAKAFGCEREVCERAYNLSSDIGLVALTAAREGPEGVRRFSVRVGIPVRCMLAERLASAEEILEKLGGRGFAEYKYDGERMQIHKSGETVVIFSRRQENITSQYPDVVEMVRKGVSAKEAILECEAVPLDPETGETLPFQELMHRKRKKEIEKAAEEYPVALYFFDILYVDGEDLTTQPLPIRRKKLEEIVVEGERMRLSTGRMVETPMEVEKFFAEAVEAGCEGLMIKSVDEESVYRAGARGWQWIKLKRDYRSEMIDTVDLVVVGAFHGRGRRKGRFGALLMAVYNPEKDVFQTVCKVGSGFKDVDLETLTERVNRLRLDAKHPRVEALMEPDVWVQPSLVLEIIGAEVTLSPVHTCAWDVVKQGYGLGIRFPRFTGRVRDDKKPEDATTDSEIVEMYRSQLKKVEAE